MPKRDLKTIQRQAMLLASTAVTALVVNAAGAAAAEMEEAKADFQTYCASCHGRDGDGDGPVASELVTKPPSLKQVAKRRGGKFGATEVYMFIDGRDMPRAHGTSDMPVWGTLFAFQAEAEGVLQNEMVESQRVARLRIERLVKYLETIQEP